MYYRYHFCAVLALFALIITHLHASADSTFQQIFGEFPGSEQVNSLVNKEKKEPGETPKSSLESELLLHESSLARIDKMIEWLRKVVNKGGWPTLEPKGLRIKIGDAGQQVVSVKKLLLRQGDLKKSRVNIIHRFDDSLEDAIIKFQKRHGLRTSGYIDRRTRLAMAVSANTRLGQLLINRKRLKKAISKLKGSRYVVVNVPDYSLQAINEGRIELSSKVVVGREDRQTPVITAEIEGVNFHPFWYVPKSLIKEDLIPSQIKDPNFLKDNQIRVYKEWGGPELKPSAISWKAPDVWRYKFRQDPGDHNALGLIRIQMPNHETVYLHDTPTKKLYGLRARAYSAGCVRVERIRDLTAWILKDKEKWNRSRIDEVLENRKRKNVMIKKKLHVQFVYITAWVDAKNNINYREDIYDRDKGLKKYASRIEKVKGGRTLSP